MTIIIHYFNFHRLKKSTSKHLSQISKEIEEQEQLYSELENQLMNSGDLESQNQAKFEYIKMEIIQLDHSLGEICKFI